MVQLLLPIIEWQPMSTAPRDCTWILARDRTGYLHEVHYACGDGDGLMPPFDGFFRRSSVYGYIQVTGLVEWKAI